MSSVSPILILTNLWVCWENLFTIKEIAIVKLSPELRGAEESRLIKSRVLQSILVPMCLQDTRKVNVHTVCIEITWTAA